MPKPINVKVTSMDAELEFAIQASTMGRQLFDQVVKTIGLREVWYFGLQYVDVKGDITWLKLNKKVMNQDVRKDSPLQFKFRAKFYPEDVSEELIQEITQRLFYLQVKDAILSDEVYCPPETAVLLASYACQAKYSDYERDLHPPGFLATDRILPQRVLEQHNLTHEEWEDKIVKWFGEHRNMMREDAMLEYLKIAQDLEMYGVNYFEIKNKKGTDLWLGVDALGLNVYQQDDKLTPKIGFPWSEIRNISFSDKKFVIKSTDRKAQDFVFFAPRLRINKRILALCMGNHELYMRRRKQDTIEVQQMKAQAKEEREAKLQERRRWATERMAREDMERKLRELEISLRDKANQHELTKRELEEYQAKTRDLERLLAEMSRQRAEVEEMQRRLEEKNQELQKSAAQSDEERANLLTEREAIQEEIRVKNSELESRVGEQRAAEEELERIRLERDEKARQLEMLSHVTEDTSNEEDGDTQYEHNLEVIENGELSRREEERETQVATNKDLAAQLKSLSEDLQKNRDDAKVSHVDKLHEENQRKGLDKFKTLRNIRQGNTKKRVDEFESM